MSTTTMGGDRTVAGIGLTGWGMFGAVTLIVLGGLNIVNGFTAIHNSQFFTHQIVYHNLTAWGWVQLILGALVGLTGIGLLVGSGVARVLGISLLAINAILQIVWFSAAPLWAFLMIILDVVIIYQLMVNWTEEV